MSKIPLCKANVSDLERKYVNQVLDSGWLADGDFLASLNTRFAKWNGSKHALAVSSCTAALHLALEALGIGKGDDVIVPSFTFPASPNTILMSGAKPVFCDVDIETYNTSAQHILDAATPQTKAVMVVHYAGLPCNMYHITRLCRDRGWFLIEDCAQAQGSKYGRYKVGNYGDVGCFSFYPTKIMTSGQGGMLTFSDPELLSTFKELMSHGIRKPNSPNLWNRSQHRLGYNYRMSELDAAFGLAQLKRVDEFIRGRLEVAQAYDRHLPAQFIRPHKKNNVYQMYVARLVQNRNKIINAFITRGIEATAHFDPPCHLQPFYKQLVRNRVIKKSCCPNTEYLADHVISLPMYYGLGPAPVIQAARKIVGE